MRTREVQRWMSEHPRSIHGACETIISRCTLDVGRRAARDAWMQAREILDHEHRRWENSHGNHASPGFVTREVCADIASKLRHLEPVVPQGNEAQILDEETRDSLESDAFEKIRPWLHDLAVRAEHDEWMQIIEFTKKRGRSIAREEKLGSDAHWQNTREYAEVAAFVTGVLLRDYMEHTH